MNNKKIQMGFQCFWKKIASGRNNERGNSNSIHTKVVRMGTVSFAILGALGAVHSVKAEIVADTTAAASQQASRPVSLIQAHQLLSTSPHQALPVCRIIFTANLMLTKMVLF